MRIRYLKNTDEILAESPLILPAPRELKGKWRGELGRRMGREPEKLYLEIGCGMGGFLRKMAEREPEAGFIGVERISTVLARAVGRPENAENMRTANAHYAADNRTAEECPNLVFAREVAEDLCEAFEDGEVDGIFLNFSDPWPKERHAKRRLTSDRHLRVYARVLKQGGILRFKTDNDLLFPWSVESFLANGWEILRQTDDLHADGEPLAEGNVLTEYEAAFLRKGKNIHCLEARFAGEKADE